MHKPVISFDLETHTFGPYHRAPEVVCLSWATHNHSAIQVGIDIEEWLHRNLRGAGTRWTLVGHNVAYDWACILANYPQLWDLVWEAYRRDGIDCTQNREKLLNISQGEFRHYVDDEGETRKAEYRLEDIVRRRLGKQLQKRADSWRLRYAELQHIPLADWPQSAKDYALNDAKETLAVYIQQEERAGTLSYSMPTRFHENRADFALKLMSTWGIETELPRVEQLWDNTTEQLETLSQTIEQAGLAKITRESLSLFPTRKDIGYTIKKSMSSIRAAIEQTYTGLEIPKTPKGSIQTGKDILQKCESPALKSLIQFNKLQKQKSTYIEKLFSPILHANFFGIGASSDRTSCSKPNLQNQLRLAGFRECFKARLGYVYLTCDFDSQEMRTLAQACLDICGTSRLAEMYQKDTHFDPHLALAATLAQIPFELAEERLKNKDKKIKELRQHAKVCNFGFPGGMGIEVFRESAKDWGVILSQREATNLKKAWFIQWPEMKTYFAAMAALTNDECGTVTIPQSGFERGGCRYTDASNTNFQTLAAHASKDALWEVSQRCYNGPGSALYGSRPVLFIHDEIVLEVPEFAGHEAALEIEQVMVEAMERWTPDVPAAASATLMKYWSKEAERVFENGRLVAWNT